MTCRNCELYDLDSTKTPTGRVRSSAVAKCGWEQDPGILFPSSVTRYFSFKGTTPPKSFMQPNDGKDCACFIKRKPS